MSISAGPSPGSFWLFLVLAFGWTWVFWVPVALRENGLLVAPDALTWLLFDGKPAAWGPLIAALVVRFRQDRLTGVRALVASMLRVRFSFTWHLVALLLVPAIVGAAQLIAMLAGETIPASEAFLNPVSIPIAFAWIFFFGGPLQEEAGWRATSSRILEGRMGAAGAAVLTGIIWGLWHLPLFYMPRAEAYYNQPIWGLVISTVLLSVLLSWVYNNTRQSLFAAMVMHTSWNWANYLFTGLHTDTGGLAFLLLMAGVVLIVLLRFGPDGLVRDQNRRDGPNEPPRPGSF